RGRLGTEPGGDDLGVLRRGQRVAQRVEGEPHEEPPLVMVAALQQRDMQVLTGLERAERRGRQREATGDRAQESPDDGSAFKIAATVLVRMHAAAVAALVQPRLLASAVPCCSAACLPGAGKMHPLSAIARENRPNAVGEAMFAQTLAP